MQPDKEIMDFVLIEKVPDGKGSLRLVIDNNRRTDPRVQRWVMDQVKTWPGALKEFVSLSELNARREQQSLHSENALTANDRDKDISANQQKVVRYMALASQLGSSDIHFTISNDRRITVIEMRIHGDLEVVDELTHEEGWSLVSTIYRSMCDLRDTDFIASRDQKGRVEASFAVISI
jgi:type II secretory ATPase GspE/PulE/Tfp pilus assembly ATPase PilB-like protein